MQPLGPRPAARLRGAAPTAPPSPRRASREICPRAGRSRAAVTAVVVALGVLATLSACSDESVPPRTPTGPSVSGALAAGAPDTASGTLVIQWGDPPQGSGPVRLTGLLATASGEMRRLALDEAVVAAAGGVRALDRRPVFVEGVGQPGAPLAVRAIRVTGAARVKTPRQPASRPYVVLLCKFASSPAIEPRPASVYQSWLATSYPGLDHFWRELSYDAVSLAGSTVRGWYTLPAERSAYFGPNGSLDLTRLTTDCTGAADADVYFPDYFGVAIQVNEVLDCCSWGGTGFLNLDGLGFEPTPMMWLASWADLSVYAHESGHAFGFPHSSGPYGATYDSKWDVMSNAYVRYDPARGTYIPQHTITDHLDAIGWIPADQRLELGPGSQKTLVLDRLALPPSERNYLMVKIPVGSSSTQYYTVEARDLVSYDVGVPARAVVIHQVGLAGNGWANVVDPDGNGDPNDAGARWTAGETFTDAANGVTVAVKAETKSGFRVTVSRR